MHRPLATERTATSHLEAHRRGAAPSSAAPTHNDAHTHTGHGSAAPRPRQHATPSRAWSSHAMHVCPAALGRGGEFLLQGRDIPSSLLDARPQPPCPVPPRRRAVLQHLNNTNNKILLRVLEGLLAAAIQRGFRTGNSNWVVEGRESPRRSCTCASPRRQGAACGNARSFGIRASQQPKACFYTAGRTRECGCRCKLHVPPSQTRHFLLEPPWSQLSNSAAG